MLTRRKMAIGPRSLFWTLVLGVAVVGINGRPANARPGQLVPDLPILSRAIDAKGLPDPLAHKLELTLGSPLPAMVSTGTARVNGGAIQAFGAKGALCIANSPEAPAAIACRPIGVVRRHGLNLATPCRGPRSTQVRVSGIVSSSKGKVVLEQDGSTAMFDAPLGAYSFLVAPEDAVLRSASGGVIARFALGRIDAGGDCFG